MKAENCKQELNRATLEFASKLSQVIIENDEELVVAVNPMEQETTGQGNINILDLAGVERTAVFFMYRPSRSDYAISAFDVDVVTFATSDMFYDVASRIIKGSEG